MHHIFIETKFCLCILATIFSKGSIPLFVSHSFRNCDIPAQAGPIRNHLPRIAHAQQQSRIFSMNPRQVFHSTFECIEEWYLHHSQPQSWNFHFQRRLKDIDPFDVAFRRLPGVCIVATATQEAIPTQHVVLWQPKLICHEAEISIPEEEMLLDTSHGVSLGLSRQLLRGDKGEF